MRCFAGLLTTALLVFSSAGAEAQPYGQPNTGDDGTKSTYALNSLAGQQMNNPVLVTLNNAMKQLSVSWPQNSINFMQLQALMKQFPGMSNLQVQFPNQTNWSVSPSQLTTYYNQFTSQAGNLGFGVGNTQVPQLVFSSLASQMTGNSGYAMVPVNAFTSGTATALDPILRELRYEQLALSDSLPDWLKNILLAFYNVFVPIYLNALEWVLSIWAALWARFS